MIHMDDERKAVVAYLRSEAAISLCKDMQHFDRSAQEQLDTIVSVLEAYADAIERGEHLLNA